MSKMIDRSLLSGTTVCYPLSVSPLFTLERALEGISRVGLRFVELMAISGYCEHLKPAQMGDKEVQGVRQLLKKCDLTPNAVSVVADLTTESGVELLGHAMRVARALDVDTIISNVDQTDTEEGKARFIEMVPSILSLAEQHDVVIALETHGGIVTTGIEGAALFNEIGSERLKLTYDIANVIYCGGVRPEEDLTQLGSDIGRIIGRVHLKDKANMKLWDYDFPPFGKGIIDFGTVLDLLYKGGYRGAMTLEVELDGKPESPELVDEALLHSYRYLEQFWSD